jgi:plastocyanin
MRFTLIVSLFILTASIALAADTNPNAKQINVDMKSISYDPKIVNASIGDSIVWTNKAFSNHTATSDDDGKSFDTGEITPGESSSPVKFDKEGEFQYQCKIHGKTMSGTVVVKPAASN